MSFQELDRVYIRHFLGFSAVFLQADPRLEASITAVQAIADGGARPDSSSENYAKGLIYGSSSGTGTSGNLVTLNGTAQNVTFPVPAMRGLLQVEANIEFLDNIIGGLEADDGDIKLDTAREMIRLRMDGRRKVFALARVLGMRGARIDVFSGVPIMGDDDPFAYDDSPFW